MKLWVTQTFSQLEATVVDFTILLVIADAVKNDPRFGEAATAVVFALQFIPALPSALLAGVIADVIDRRILLFSINLFRAIFLLIFVFNTDPGPHLYFFVFVMAVCMHTYDVIEKASLRNVTNDQELGLANGLFLFTLNGTTLIGVVMAGLLKNSLGLQGVLLSGAVLFGLGAFLTYKLPRNFNQYRVDHYVEKIKVIPTTGRALGKLGKSITQTFKYLITIPPVWLAMILATLVQTVILMIASVSFRFGSDVLNITSEQVSIFLLIPIAGGLAAGGAMTPFFTKKFNYRKTVSVSWFLCILLLIILGGIGFVTRNLRPAVDLQFILFEILIVTLGIAVTLIQAPSLELIQKFADPKVRGRIFGILVGATNTISGILVASSGIFIELLRSGKNDVLGTSKYMLFVAAVLFLLWLGYRKLVKKILGNKDFTEYNVVTATPIEKPLENPQKII